MSRKPKPVNKTNHVCKRSIYFFGPFQALAAPPIAVRLHQLQTLLGMTGALYLSRQHQERVREDAKECPTCLIAQAVIKIQHCG
jgi:hypothetical protein